jgi:hypothetical protein
VWGWGAIQSNPAAIPMVLHAHDERRDHVNAECARQRDAARYCRAMHERPGEAVQRAIVAYMHNDLTQTIAQLRVAISIGKAMRLSHTESRNAVLREFAVRLHASVCDRDDASEIIDRARDEIAEQFPTLN